MYLMVCKEGRTFALREIRATHHSELRREIYSVVTLSRRQPCLSEVSAWREAYMILALKCQTMASEKYCRLLTEP